MPAIDYSGAYRAKARQGQAAIAFPIKASRMEIAARYANKMVLKLLPGFTHGTVVLEDKKSGERWVWELDRAKSEAKR